MLEREYNVPLRREFLKSPRYKRTNRAVSALRAFISKHMKSDDVSLGRHLNNKLWENGIKNPPHKVTVLATKDDSGKVTVELKDVPKLRPKVNKRLARVVKSEGKDSEEKESDKKEKAEANEEEKSDSKKSTDKSNEKPATDSSKKSEKPKEPVTVEKKGDSTEKGESKKSVDSKPQTDASTKKEEKNK